MHTPLTESIVQFHLGEYRRPTIESLPRGYRKRLGELSYNLRSAECRLLEKYLRLLREDPKLEIELFLPPGVSPFDPRTPEQVRFREIPGTQGYTVPADGVYIPLVDRLHRRGCFPKSPSGLAIGAASEWCDGHLRWWTGEILSLEEAHVRRQEQKLWHDQLLLKLLRCGVYDLFWYQRTRETREKAVLPERLLIMYLAPDAEFAQAQQTLLHDLLRTDNLFQVPSVPFNIRQDYSYLTNFLQQINQIPGPTQSEQEPPKETTPEPEKKQDESNTPAYIKARRAGFTFQTPPSDPSSPDKSPSSQTYQIMPKRAVFVPPFLRWRRDRHSQHISRLKAHEAYIVRLDFSSPRTWMITKGRRRSRRYQLRKIHQYSFFDGNEYRHSFEILRNRGLHFFAKNGVDENSDKIDELAFPNQLYLLELRHYLWQKRNDDFRQKAARRYLRNMARSVRDLADWRDPQDMLLPIYWRFIHPDDAGHLDKLPSNKQCQHVIDGTLPDPEECDFNWNWRGPPLVGPYKKWCHTYYSLRTEIINENAGRDEQPFLAWDERWIYDGRVANPETIVCIWYNLLDYAKAKPERLALPMSSNSDWRGEVKPENSLGWITEDGYWHRRQELLHLCKCTDLAQREPFLLYPTEEQLEWVDSFNIKRVTRRHRNYFSEAKWPYGRFVPRKPDEDIYDYSSRLNNYIVEKFLMQGFREEHPVRLEGYMLQAPHFQQGPVPEQTEHDPTFRLLWN